MEKINEILEDEELESNVRFNLGQVNDMWECLLEYREILDLKLKHLDKSNSDKLNIAVTKVNIKTVDELLNVLAEENQRYENMALGE